MSTGYGNSGYGDVGYGTGEIYEYPIGLGFSRGSYSSPGRETIAKIENFSNNNSIATSISFSPEKTTIPFNTQSYGSNGYGAGGYGTDTTFAISSGNIFGQENIAAPSVIAKNTSNSSVTERIGKGLEDAGIGSAITTGVSFSPKIGTATTDANSISIPSVVTPELIVTLDRSVLEENYGAFINDLNMKDGDTHPPIRAELYGLTDEQFYYSDISVIVEHIDNNEIVVNTAVDERNSITNKVSYYWNDDGSDLPYTGEYRVEFEITHPDGRTETFPPSRYLKFEVKEGLN